MGSKFACWVLPNVCVGKRVVPLEFKVKKSPAQTTANQMSSYSGLICLVKHPSVASMCVIASSRALEIALHVGGLQVDTKLFQG
jgi:hypothetical protein